MKLRWRGLLALILAGFFPALTLYIAQTGRPPGLTELEAARVAVFLARQGSTFQFDGIPETVGVERVEALGPSMWRVTVAFVSRHAGYGDRTGRVLLPVLTPHQVRVTIVGQRIAEAIIDGVWDELAQKPVER